MGKKAHKKPKKNKRPSKQIKKTQKQNHKTRKNMNQSTEPKQKPHNNTVLPKSPPANNKNPIGVKNPFSVRSLSWTDLLESCKSSRSVQRGIKTVQLRARQLRPSLADAAMGLQDLEHRAGWLLFFSTCCWIYFNSSPNRRLQEPENTGRIFNNISACAHLLLQCKQMKF